MKKIIAFMLFVAMTLSGTCVSAGNETGYGGGATNGMEIAAGTIKVEVEQWESDGKYTRVAIVQSSYAGGGPTLDENGDCLVPLVNMSVFWNYDIKDEDNTITLSHENRTIVVPYDGDTAVVDGRTIEFPHEHIVPLYADWDAVFDNEIYFHYSYLPSIFGVEKAEWDKDNMRLVITENATTPMSNREKAFRDKDANPVADNSNRLSPPDETEIPTRPQTDGLSAYIGTAPRFSDMDDASSTLNACVNELADGGVIAGYNDNTFRPYSPVTRAEAAAMICRLMGFEMKGVNGFSDVPLNEWYYDPIGAVTEIGIVDGYDDGTFRPDNNITYHEMFKLAYCLLGQPDEPYSRVIPMAVARGLTDELSSFTDDAPVTRGDMCILLSKLLDTYITTWETDDGNVYYGASEMTLSDYLAGHKTVYHYFCSKKQMDEYGATKK